MSKPVKFKKYYIEIEAVKITHSNFKQLIELDNADGVLGGIELESDLIGDWFATGTNGFQVISGSEKLLPAS
jgi:hypothetical protein